MRLSSVAAQGFGVLVGVFLLSNTANAQPILCELYGSSTRDDFGISVSDVGDVDKDTYPDFIVGALQQLGDPGYARVFSGRDCGELWTLNGDPSFGVNFGISVSSAGDVNLDSYPDIVVGDHDYFEDRPDPEPDRFGSATVFSGKDQTVLAAFYGDKSRVDQLGVSVSDAGDVNKDDYPDVIVGAPQWKDTINPKPGYARVFSGKFIATRLGPAILCDLVGQWGDSHFGGSVSGAGDVNKDGYADVIVGAGMPPEAAPSGPGYAQVFFGPGCLESRTFDGDEPGDQLGTSVSDAGDVNKDDYPDVIVGAPQAGQNSIVTDGYVRVLSGKFIALGTLPEVVYEFTGSGGRFGGSVSNAGDMNQDTYPDLIVGAERDDSQGTMTGAAYMFSGQDGTLLYGFYGNPPTTYGQSGFGLSVSGAGGDLNRDGFDDAIVGAYCGGAACAGMVRVYVGLCGDSIVSPGEECDDGNTTPGDGCDEFCKIEDFFCCGSPNPCNRNNACTEPGDECCDGQCCGDRSTPCADDAACAAGQCCPDCNRMYWTDASTRKIHGADLCGNSVTTIYGPLDCTEPYCEHAEQQPEGVAIDAAEGKIYWTDNSNDDIYRGDLDGSGVPELLVDLPDEALICGIALDLNSGKVYWADAGCCGFPPPATGGKIQRANLDGTGPEDVITGISPSCGLALDLQAGEIYWTDIAGSQTNQMIRRTAIPVGPPKACADPGVMCETLVTGISGAGSAGGVALHESMSKLYFVENGEGSIKTVSIDGPPFVVDDPPLVTGLLGPMGIALDLKAGSMYWALNTGTSDSKIQRANLDGTEIESLVCSGLIGAFGVALDLSKGSCGSCCGDGISNACTEECEDGNATPGDGCDERCEIERVCCDNPQVDCTSSDDSACVALGDTCCFGMCGSADCKDLTLVPCDDPVVECKEAEQCCPPLCGICGDGVKRCAEKCDLAAGNCCLPGVTCDPGVPVCATCAACTVDCEATGVCVKDGVVTGRVCVTAADCGVGEGCCGNGGSPEPGEECDDGNCTDGDCCSAVCMNEPAAQCVPPCQGVAGPHLLSPVSMKGRFKDRDGDGKLESWTTGRKGRAGDFNLAFGQSVDCGTEDVRVVFSENDGSGGRVVLGEFTLGPDDWDKVKVKPGTDDETCKMKDRTETKADPDGVALGLIKERGTKVKYKFKGKSLARIEKPSQALIRVCVHVGDDAGTAMLKCASKRGGSLFKCDATN